MDATATTTEGGDTRALATLLARAADGWDDAKVHEVLQRRMGLHERWLARGSWLGPDAIPASVAEAEGIAAELAAADLELGAALECYRGRHGYAAMVILLTEHPHRLCAAAALRMIAAWQVIRSANAGSRAADAGGSAPRHSPIQIQPDTAHAIVECCNFLRGGRVLPATAAMIRAVDADPAFGGGAGGGAPASADSSPVASADPAVEGA
jgi:hypothetical protein